MAQNKNPLTLSLQMLKLGGIFNPAHLFGRAVSSGAVKPCANIFKDLLLGSKKEVGLLKGTRKRWIGPPRKLSGYRLLSPKELSSIPKDKLPRVKRMTINGKKVSVIRKSSYGGVAGLAQRHPFYTAGGAVALNELRKLRKGTFSGLKQQMLPHYQPIEGSTREF